MGEMTNEQKLRVAVQALWDVISPVEKVRRELEPGYVLDGLGCVLMAKEPETYRRIARDALREIGEAT